METCWGHSLLQISLVKKLHKTYRNWEGQLQQKWNFKQKYLKMLITGCSLGSRHFHRRVPMLVLKEPMSTLLILLYILPFDFSRTKLMLITLEWISNALLFVLHAWKASDQIFSMGSKHLVSTLLLFNRVHVVDKSFFSKQPSQEQSDYMNYTGLILLDSNHLLKNAL